MNMKLDCPSRSAQSHAQALRVSKWELKWELMQRSQAFTSSQASQVPEITWLSHLNHRCTCALHLSKWHSVPQCFVSPYLPVAFMANWSHVVLVCCFSFRVSEVVAAVLQAGSDARTALWARWCTTDGVPQQGAAKCFDIMGNF